MKKISIVVTAVMLSIFPIEHWINASLIVSIAWATSPDGTTGSKPLSPVETLSAKRDLQRVISGQQFFGNAKYVGSESCKSCHLQQYDEWAATWHAKMERWPSPDIIVGDFNDRIVTYKDTVVKTKDGKEEKVTFSVRTHRQGNKFLFTVLDNDNPDNNQTYEIAKVLGGNWDQHYEIKLGENYLPTPIRWSITAKDWLISSYRPYEWVEVDGTPDGRPRRPDELQKGRFAEAKCAGCHTTGFEFYKDAQAGHWKARGNGELGIACERCHGPASRHVEEAQAAQNKGETLAADKTTIVHPLKDLSPFQQTQVCAQCHGRNTNKKIADISFQQGFLPGDIDMTSRSRFWSYSGTSNPDEYKYFWPNDWGKRNRQQWQDFTKSVHFNKAGMSCITCHTFHGKWEDAQLRQKPAELCIGCHTNFGRAKRPNLEIFSDSPMAKAGVQCVNCHMPKIGYRSDKTASGPHPWDVSSHTFMVSTPALEREQGIRSSCATCHEGEGKKMPSGVQAPPFDATILDYLLRQRQASTRQAIDEVDTLLAKAKATTPQAQQWMEQARGKLNFVLLDGSLGFHNYVKVMEIIGEAKSLAQKAAQSK